MLVLQEIQTNYSVSISSENYAKLWKMMACPTPTEVKFCCIYLSSELCKECLDSGMLYVSLLFDEYLWICIRIFLFQSGCCLIWKRQVGNHLLLSDVYYDQNFYFLMRHCLFRRPRQVQQACEPFSFCLIAGSPLLFPESGTESMKKSCRPRVI